MKTMKQLIHLHALPLMLLLALVSCRQKDLCYDHLHTGTLTVVFDWTDAPDASPETMSLYLFPTDGGSPQRYEFTNRDGGTITLSPGTYRAICLNSDTETSLYRGIDCFETFEVYTREAGLLEPLGIRSVSAGIPRADGTDGEQVSLTPDRLWCGRTDGDTADGFTLAAGGTSVLTLRLKEATCHYSVEIRNASNLKYVSGLSGTLSGMAGGTLPGMGTPTAGQPCILPFEVAVDGGTSTVTGSFLTFGECPGGGGSSGQYKHQLVVYAILADGSQWYYTYDVTKQVSTAPDPHHVHILLDGLPLPKPIVDGGGFHPDVDDWEDVEVNIDM